MPTLTTNEAARLALRGHSYVPTPRPVTAHRTNRAGTWETRKGDRLTNDAGDWIIEEQGRSRTIKDPVFRRVYTHLTGNHYQKVTPVRAVRLDRAITIKTLEGTAAGVGGDWLVTNGGDDAWILTDFEFRKRYILAADI